MVFRRLGVLMVTASAATLWMLGGCSNATNELLRASAVGDLEGARRCIEAGADVNAPQRHGFRLENDGDTPLIVAVQNDQPEMVGFLIARGADVNLGFAGRPDGTSPLSIASARGRIDVVRVLIDAGARVDGRDKDWMSPLAYAVTQDHFDVADLLVGKGAKPDVWTFRAALNSRDAGERQRRVRYLLDHGLDPNGTDHDGRSLVRLAEESNAAEIAVMLRSAGAGG